MKIEQILYNIETGDMALPEFQRGYVWNRDQVRSLFSSLYRGYPVGGFMVWHTSGEAKQRGGLADASSTIKLLLDGQQRATSLYGVIRGKPPAFFDGNDKAFTGLHFNLVDEVFEFYAQTKMKGDPAWIDVSDLMGQGIGPFIAAATALAGDSSDLVGVYVGRLSQLIAVEGNELHIEDVGGADKNVDVLVDIFNRVNSGGTKLSKGDLTLAKICARWPEAREHMNGATCRLAESRIRVQTRLAPPRGERVRHWQSRIHVHGGPRGIDSPRFAGQVAGTLLNETDDD